MEGFDFTASPKLPAAQIRDLAALPGCTPASPSSFTVRSASESHIVRVPKPVSRRGRAGSSGGAVRRAGARCCGSLRPISAAKSGWQGPGAFRRPEIGVGAVRGAELNMANVDLRQRANAARWLLRSAASRRRRGLLHQRVDDFLGAAAGPCRALSCCRAGPGQSRPSELRHQLPVADRFQCRPQFCQQPPDELVGGTGVAVGGSTSLSSRPDWAARQVAAASSSGRTGIGGRPAIAAPVSRMTSARKSP